MQKSFFAFGVLALGAVLFGTTVSAQTPSDQVIDQPAQAITSPANPAEFDTAAAALAPINNSGISARLFFANDSKTLVVSGIASGLDPTKTYVSLVYNKGSVATGPTACLPTNTTVSWYQMVLGYWLPMGSSTRYLLVFKSAPATSSLFTAYVPIDAVSTTSVRLDTQPSLPLPPTANPTRFVLQACGLINSGN